VLLDALPTDDRHQQITTYLGSVFGENLHVKRIESLSGATLGVIKSSSLAVCTIGQALAQARELTTKHAIKQVDRLLSNSAIDVWEMFADWVPEVVGNAQEIAVVIDWTEFDADDQATLVASLVTSHGRSTPLIWLTVWKDELENAQSDYEDAVLRRLWEVLPPDVAVTVLADRGFGDRKLMGFLEELGFDYVIRIRGNITLEAANGETRKSAQWVGKNGRARKLSNARITRARKPVPAVVCVHAKGMKEPWCLVTSKAEAKAAEIKNLYSRRWTVEPTFRDTKDLRFGMGLKSVRVSEPQRRDRMLLLSAFAITFLTLLGEAGESLGMDRLLKSNTARKRVHSLFRQGCMLYELMPGMPEHRLAPLVERFAELIHQRRMFQNAFAKL
jgi:hypothetical protein